MGNRPSSSRDILEGFIEVQEISSKRNPGSEFKSVQQTVGIQSPNVLNSEQSPVATASTSSSTKKKSALVRLLTKISLKKPTFPTEESREFPVKQKKLQESSIHLKDIQVIKPGDKRTGTSKESGEVLSTVNFYSRSRSFNNRTMYRQYLNEGTRRATDADDFFMPDVNAEEQLSAVETPVREDSISRPRLASTFSKTDLPNINRFDSDHFWSTESNSAFPSL